MSYMYAMHVRNTGTQHMYERCNMYRMMYAMQIRACKHHLNLFIEGDTETSHQLNCCC